MTDERLSRLITFTYPRDCVTDLNPALNIPARHDGGVRVWLRETSVTCWRSHCSPDVGMNMSLHRQLGVTARMLGRQLIKCNCKRVITILVLCFVFVVRTKRNRTKPNFATHTRSDMRVFATQHGDDVATVAISDDVSAQPHSQTAQPQKWLLKEVALHPWPGESLTILNDITSLQYSNSTCLPFSTGAGSPLAQLKSRVVSRMRSYGKPAASEQLKKRKIAKEIIDVYNTAIATGLNHKNELKSLRQVGKHTSRVD